jgi:hypothetical protein
VRERAESRPILTQIKVAYRPKVYRSNSGLYARSIPMMDVIMVAIAFAFFAVSIAYVYACESL